MTTPTDYGVIADRLVSVFIARGYSSGHLPPDGEHTLAHSVTVRRKFERYPWATIWIDDDGLTWGDRFEHNQPVGDVGGRSERLVDAVLATEVKP
jgi:hypothetical protein